MSHTFGSRFPSSLHASPQPQPSEAADRLIVVGAGGAFLGASLAGVAGAIVGGVFGLAAAHAANRSAAQKS